MKEMDAITVGETVYFDFKRSELGRGVFTPPWLRAG